MIKIEIEAATGAEARQQLMDLLGSTSSPADKTNVSAVIAPAEVIHDQVNKETEQEAPVKKRRTKAEIEAATKIADAAPQEKEPVETPAEEQPDDIQGEETNTSGITVEMLQAKAVELGRAGKKELAKATLAKFGAECISPKGVGTPLDPKDYGAAMDALNAL